MLPSTDRETGVAPPRDDGTAWILTYHSIDDSGSVVSTAPARFREHMETLRRAGCRVVRLAELARCIREGRPFPPRAVALTFDDGLRNFHDAAYPILRDCEFPATVFLVPSFIGGRNRWDDALRTVPDLELLDWEQIRELSAEGVDFGAHTLTHANLAELPLERAKGEIAGSKAAIEEKLGRAADLFAYPYGRKTVAVREFVRDLFGAACSTRLACATPTSDLAALPRIEMRYFSRSRRFRRFGTRSFSGYVRWRALLRWLRGLDR